MKYSKHTESALNAIESTWKGLEDIDRTVIGDAVEAAIAAAVKAAQAEDNSDLATVRRILGKSK